MKSTSATPTFWSGGFLYDPNSASVFLHERDGRTNINPHAWAFFGGLNEPGETFEACFIRELSEEIGLSVLTDELILLREYLNTDLNTYRVVFYIETDTNPESLTLNEGAGFSWIPISKLDGYNLTTKTREDLTFFASQLSCRKRSPSR